MRDPTKTLPTVTLFKVTKVVMMEEIVVAEMTEAMAVAEEMVVVMVEVVIKVYSCKITFENIFGIVLTVC